MERSLHSIVRALPDDEVDVAVNRVVDGPWSLLPEDAHRLSIWRCYQAPEHRRLRRLAIATAGNPVRRLLSAHYDLHIAMRWGPDMTRSTKARHRTLIPGGNPVGDLEERYDTIALEAPDNRSFLGGSVRAAVVAPPLWPLSNHAEVPGNLPDRYFLTVFNPYGTVKGTDDLEAIIDSLPLPIVWCHSARSISSDIPEYLAKHPNLIHVEDPSVHQLRYLYEECYAYLSFSRSEGFGWSIADALRYSRRVVSRPVGVLSFPAAHQAGVHLLRDGWSDDLAFLEEIEPCMGLRDLSWLDPAGFRARLLELVG